VELPDCNTMHKEKLMTSFVNPKLGTLKSWKHQSHLHAESPPMLMTVGVDL
jgi:hypothetical protein